MITKSTDAHVVKYTLVTMVVQVGSVGAMDIIVSQSKWKRNRNGKEYIEHTKGRGKTSPTLFYTYEVLL